MFGSLYITSINGLPLTNPTLIYGVPRVVRNFKQCTFGNLNQELVQNFLPSNSKQTGPEALPQANEAASQASGNGQPYNLFMKLPPCSSFYLANKWNGFPITGATDLAALKPFNSLTSNNGCL